MFKSKKMETSSKKEINTKIKLYLLRVCYYLFFSNFLAIFGYYYLGIMLSGQNAFGSYFRMMPYHQQHPVFFILIPCFFYTVIATYFTSNIDKLTKTKQFIVVFKIIILTILISCPIGGILYFYYDMAAGHFPPNWIEILLKRGISTGFHLGWLIILLSFPYNIIGVICCYFLTKDGNLFAKKILNKINE